MGATIQADDIADLVNGVVGELNKKKITDLSQTLTDYPAARMFMAKQNVKTFATTSISYNIQKSANTARNVGMYGVDSYNRNDKDTRITAPWRSTTVGAVFEQREVDMQGTDAEVVVDLIEQEDRAAVTGTFEHFEMNFWTKPNDSSDALKPWGLPLWVVKPAAGSDSFGFNGLNPAGYSAGAGGLSSTDVPAWANGTGRYGAMTQADGLRLMREATVKCDFKTIRPYKSNSEADRFGLYTNYNVIQTLEEYGEQKGDGNLKQDQLKDLAFMDGECVFKRRPITYAPYLDNDTTDPVYGLNWGTLWFCVLRNWYMRRSAPRMPASQHTVRVWDIDNTYNFLCVNRRANWVVCK